MNIRKLIALFKFKFKEEYTIEPMKCREVIPDILWSDMEGYQEYIKARIRDSGLSSRADYTNLKSNKGYATQNITNTNYSNWNN